MVEIKKQYRLITLKNVIIMKFINSLIILGFLTQHALGIPYSDKIGMAFSIAALALAVPHQVVFKNHLRMLDLLQLCYLVGTTFGFTSDLVYSWAYFIPNFWHPLAKTTSTYLDVAGYLLSFAICLVGAIIISWIVTLILRWKNKTTWRFSQVFVFFKGLIRWVYLGLVALSVTMIIIASKMGGTNSFDQVYPQNIIAPGIVLLACLVYPIWLLIARINEQKQLITTDLNQKWVQFFSLMRLLLIGSFYMLTSFSTYIFIAVYIVQAAYVVTTMVITKWDNIPERIVFGITEGVIITLFSLIFYAPQIVYFERKDLDFYLITIAFGLELIYQVYKYIKWIMDHKSKRVAEQGSSVLQADNRNINHLDDVEIEMKNRNGSHKNLDSSDSLAINPTLKKNLNKESYDNVSPPKPQKMRVKDNDTLPSTRRK